MTDKIVGIAPAGFADAMAMAEQLAKARGFVPRDMVGQPAAIVAAIMTGAEIGIGPMQALRSIHVIEGRPTLSADLMLSLALRAGIRVSWLEKTETVARVRLSREGHGTHEHSYTIGEAKRAGLSGRANWKRYPAAMLRARCISAALRAWCPDVLGAGVYVEGEIEPDDAPTKAVESAQDVIEARGEIVPPQPKPTPKLGDCKTPDALRSWCKRHGVACIKAGESVQAKVVAQGAAIDVPEADVLEWMMQDGGES